MKKHSPESGSFRPRIFLAFLLCSAGAMLAMFTFAPPPATPDAAVGVDNGIRLERDMPVPEGKADDLDRMEQEWNNRLTYPTGGLIRAGCASPRRNTIVSLALFHLASRQTQRLSPRAHSRLMPTAGPRSARSPST